MINELELLLAELDFSKSELELQSYLLDDEMRHALAVEYCYESNRLEGSTLTLPETDMAIKIGLMIPGKSMAEYLAAINHHQAIQFIREQAADHVPLSEALIRKIHNLLSRGINREQVGLYRAQPLTYPNGYTPPSAMQLPELMADMVQWLKVDGPFMGHPVLFAAETQQRLLSLQPFQENNGTTARLLMNLVLLEEGYPIFNMPADDVTRRAYLAALGDAHTHTDKTAWYRFMVEQYIQYVKSLLTRLEEKDII